MNFKAIKLVSKVLFLSVINLSSSKGFEVNQNLLLKGLLKSGQNEVKGKDLKIICHQLGVEVLKVSLGLIDDPKNKSSMDKLLTLGEQVAFLKCPTGYVEEKDFFSDEIEFFLSLDKSERNSFIQEIKPITGGWWVAAATNAIGHATNVAAVASAVTSAGQAATAAAGARRTAMTNVHGAFSSSSHHSAGPYGSLSNGSSKFHNYGLDY